MVNLAERDLRIATYTNDVAQRSIPARQGTAQRATVPGTLATRVRGLVARVVTHGRHNGTAHS